MKVITMKNPIRSFLLLFLLVFVSFVPAQAAEPDEVVAIDGRLDSLDKIEASLRKERYDEKELKEWQKGLASSRVFASACLTDKEATLKEYEQTLTGLGEPTKGEPRDVAEKRTTLSREKASIEKIQARCQLLQLRSRELSDVINKIQSRLLAQRLLHREENLFRLIVLDLDNIDIWWEKSRDFATKHSGLELLNTLEWLMLFISLPAAWYAGFVLQKFLLRKFDHKFEKEGFANEFTLALLTTGSNYLPLLFLSMAAPVYFLIATGDVRPIPIVNIFAYGLPLIVALLFVTRLLFDPVKPAKPFIEIEYEYGLKVRNRLHRIIIVGFIFYLITGIQLAGDFPEYLMQLSAMVMSTIMIFQIVMLVRLVRRSEYFRDFSWALLIVNLLLVSSQVAHLMGYVNLGNLGKRTLIGGVLLWGVTLLVHKLLSSLFDSLDQGASSWSRKIRSKVGVKEGRVFPGLFLVRLMVALILWGGFVVLMLQLFGISGTLFADVQAFIVRGVTIGTFQIVPAKFFWALVSFSTLVIVGNWIRSRMRKRWLNLLPITSSGRDTLLTLTGYLVYTVAILFALGMMGMDYSKLALIFGALSVGIGFGLQNIVSNFISGLILLFERPIRIGDWVVVGGVEGYVRKINIRATVIETFDRSEVIVPNSEFISGQVVNWTLKNIQGRAKIPVGVAYGSNTDQVREILERVARENPAVITDGRQPDPYVLFMGFGASSLDFELRCYLKDVDRRMRIISELNFAIDKAFREENIQIPFPQRDLHVKDWPEKPGALPDNVAQPDKEGGDKA
jgi:small-conductance mechanosensitive channel